MDESKTTKTIEQVLDAASRRGFRIRSQSFVLDICYTLSNKSNCAKMKFGSIVVDSIGNLAGVGWNHSPNPACSDCEHLCAGGIRQGIKSGTRLELCHAVHAEQWAILEAGHKTRGGVIAVAGVNAKGEKHLRDKSLPLGHPNRGFYCSLCARMIWAAGLKGVWVDGVDGPIFETLEEIWASSFAVGASV
jgi:deoxycytidylate deaminase